MTITLRGVKTKKKTNKTVWWLAHREVKRGWLGSDDREMTSDSVLPCSQDQTCLIWPATAHMRLIETHIFFPKKDLWKSFDCKHNTEKVMYPFLSEG